LEDKGDDNWEDNTKDSGEYQNQCRSRPTTMGKTPQFDDYNLFLIARQVTQGGLRQAIFQDGVMLFSDNDLSDAKPTPADNRDKFALGVILQQYSIGLKLNCLASKPNRESPRS
jgi:hypothetical protein